MRIEPGTDVLHYRIVDRIGEGGMGVVWRAEDRELGREVAIKVLPERVARDPHRLQRFEREARLLAALNHPNVATIHGLERSDDGVFLVMELVVGRSIEDRLAIEGPWAADDALPLMRQIVAGLAAAHDRGIIHRDLKPSNVLVTAEGRIKILDFGLAKTADDLPSGETSADSLTRTVAATRSGVLVGTMNYMSPEQIEGRPLDLRSDLFQVGMLFYEMVVGRHPFAGLTPVDVQHAILREAPDLEALEQRAPEDLVRTIARLLEKDRDYRHPDAAAVDVDLRTLHRTILGSGASGLSGEVVRRRTRRRRNAVGIVAAVAALAGFLAVAWWATHRKPPPSPAVPSRIVPLNLSDGDAYTPSFSPDGESIVFASNRTGNWDLWIARVAGGNPIRIVETPDEEFRPRWSPDGDEVAFERYGRESNSTSDLWIAPALGGAERRIVEGGSDPAWSPDGREIAFVRESDGWSRIERIAVDGAATAVPVTPLEEGVFHRRPVWTPDGRFLVFARSQGGMSGRLTRIAADGSGPMESIVDDPPGVGSDGPCVTPDGRFVVHSSDRGGTVNLWRVPLDGGTPERITSGTGPDTTPDVSSDGRRIAFVHSPRDPRIVLGDRDSGEESVVAALEGGIAWGPDLSPDGSRIAFSRKTPGRPWRIEVVPRAGGAPVAIVDGPFDAIWPRFLPDGRRILFFTWPGRQRLGLVSVDGGDLTWLTGDDEEAAYPAVSPDGLRIAYVRGQPGLEPSGIVIRGLDGGEERIVVEDATLPVFSPDGRRLAFAASRSTSGRIGIVDLDGGDPRWLTDRGTWPTWTPDGRAVAYADRLPTGMQVPMVVPVDGGEPGVLSPYRWPETNFPFVIDPGTGDVVTTSERTARASIWLAEY